jgi:hypothetical protein
VDIETKRYKYTKDNRRIIAGYSLLDHRQDEAIFEHKADATKEKLAQYKQKRRIYSTIVNNQQRESVLWKT